MARKSMHDLAVQLKRISLSGSKFQTNKANAIFMRYTQNIKNSGKTNIVVDGKDYYQPFKKVSRSTYMNAKERGIVSG